MALHRNLAPGDQHRLQQWVYADATARDAASGFAAEDVGKLSLVQDEDALYVLTNHSPATWAQASVAVLDTAGISGIQTNAEARPGLYIDQTTEAVYLGLPSGRLRGLATGIGPPVEQAGWVDFRFSDPDTNTQKTTGVTIHRDPLRGAFVRVTLASGYDRGVKFMDGVVTRATGPHTLQFVSLCTDISAWLFFGWIDSTVDVNALPPSFYNCEAAEFFSSTVANRLYGMNSVGGSGFYSHANISLTPRHVRWTIPLGPGAGMGANVFSVDHVQDEDWGSVITNLLSASPGTAIGGTAASIAPFWTAYQSTEDARFIAGYRVT